MHYLRTIKLWSSDDPLFPSTKVGIGDSGHFEAMGLARKRWKTTGKIREVFKAAFAAAGLPYHNPHSFRDTLAHFGAENCVTPEAFKAVSQNLAHNGVLTTFLSYGEVSKTRQAELIRNMGKPTPAPVDVNALFRDVAALKARIEK